MDSSEWSGRVGEVWAEEWRRTDRSFVPIDAALVDAAAACVVGLASPTILDVGCGAGTTSLSLAARLPRSAITGIDLSAALIGVAQGRSVSVPNCRFEQADATHWTSEQPFDLIASRHGVMFFADPVHAFTHLRTLARPGGALVFSCFQSSDANGWASGLSHLMPASTADPRAPGPFAFADQAYVAAILGNAGWRDAEARPLPFDYVAGEDSDPVADAVDFFQRIGPTARALRELPEPKRGRLLDGLRALVEAHRRENRVTFPAAAWIWSATA